MNQNKQQLNITTELTIPGHLIGEVVSKLAYVNELITHAVIHPDGNLVCLDLRRELTSEEQKTITETVHTVVEMMAKNARAPRIQILENRLDIETPYQQDPMPILEKDGEVMQEATGMLLLGPLLSRLIDFFEAKFLSLAADFDAQPFRFPTLIPAKYLDRVNYFKSFPNYLTFATHLREDFENINAFAENAHCEGSGLVAPDGSYSQIETLLSPAVCYHLYFYLADKPLPKNEMIVTAVGNCFRYESNNLTSLERLWNFSMREVIFVGNQDFVLQNREKARLIMKSFFEELGLAYQVESANDPFFIGEFRKQVAFQSAFQLKYEIRAALPFKASTLAIGSYNYHQDFFGRHLNITLSDGSPAHTGCVAFGLERCAYAFLAQFGFDQSKWPEIVKGNI